MIFYFSGTGNSKQIAKALGDTNTINMADAIKNKQYTYRLEKDEPLGFVFPVYFYTVPTIVEDFINQLDIQNVTYTYAEITCGGGYGQCGAVFNKLLKTKGITLNYITEVLMPDNAMLYYQIPDASKVTERIENALKLVETIKQDVDNKSSNSVPTNTLISSVTGLLYHKSLSTKKFKVEEEKCIHCNQCATCCPLEVIEMANGLPVWAKDQCTKCTSCINRCPTSAIQYGKHTKNRNRYKNPNV